MLCVHYKGVTAIFRNVAVINLEFNHVQAISRGCLSAIRFGLLNPPTTLDRSFTLRSRYFSSLFYFTFLFSDTSLPLVSLFLSTYFLFNFPHVFTHSIDFSLNSNRQLSISLQIVISSSENKFKIAYVL